ncbi:MAG: hypothetical protein NTV51_02350, partial [Verrucomicrobia bacterium]|nr:hypothetical protein [Verrucomicrobiota bacterium]
MDEVWIVSAGIVAGVCGERVANMLRLGQLFGAHPSCKLGIAPRRTLSTVAPFTRMQSHGPKRVYTPHSLEFWFGKLENDWSGAFTASQLEAGRQIYRDSEVRELELTDRDAIVHRRIEKKDEYAVIEWTSDGLTVRSSSTDRELAHALAVAGMHEIEELVADEISPLPGDPPRASLPGGSPASAGGFVHGNGHSGGNGHGSSAGTVGHAHGHSHGNGNGFGRGAAAAASGGAGG